MYNNDTMTMTRADITTLEVDSLLASGGIFSFYPSRDVALAAEEDLFLILNASQEHYAPINWGEVTPEDIQELAALERESGERAAKAWGAYGSSAYALQEANESADRLLMVQASRLNEVVNAYIGGAV